MTNIKCLVEECKYNSNYYCDANAIEVRSNGTTQVNKASQTACETFSNQNNMQG